MCECCGGDCKLCNGESMNQPLNEAYSNEVLVAYQKISEDFDAFTRLIRHRVPYEQWPKRIQIAGVSEDLKGQYEQTDCQKCVNFTQECVGDLEEVLEKGWKDCSPGSRPDKSFRAMLIVMKRWKQYLDAINLYKNKQEELRALVSLNMGAKDLSFKRIHDMGRAHNMLKNALDSPLFQNLSKHEPFWRGNNSDEEDKLQDIRCQLSCLHDNLWDIISVLVGEES